MEELPLHPALVHFAIVLPLITLVFELIYRVSKNHIYSHISFILAIFSAIFIALAMYSGNIAGPDVYPLLNEHGKIELKEHKELGLYLALAMGVLAMIKIASIRLNKNILGIIFVVGMFIFNYGVLVQGHHGGELVYEYGAGVDCPTSSDGFDEDEEDDD